MSKQVYNFAKSSAFLLYAVSKVEKKCQFSHLFQVLNELMNKMAFLPTKCIGIQYSFLSHISGIVDQYTILYCFHLSAEGFLLGKCTFFVPPKKPQPKYQYKISVCCCKKRQSSSSTTYMGSLHSVTVKNRDQG